MPKVLEFEGKTYEVPDDISDEEAIDLIQPKEEPPPRKELPSRENFPKVTPEKQEERDVVAAEIRRHEVGNDPKAIKAAIKDLQSALKQPMNGSVRKILKRELSFWERLKETKE